MDRSLGGATEAPNSRIRTSDEATGSSNSFATVALDLHTPLAQLGSIDGFYIVVEDVPVGMRLSAGRHNGDRSWSLAPGEIDGVYATLPANRSDALVLSVRVLIPDPLGYEFASTVARFDVVISPDARQLPVAARIEKYHDPHKYPSSEDRVSEERRLAAAHTEWEAETDARLERARLKWEADEKERWSARDAELSARYHGMLTAAETRYRQQLVDRIVTAEAQWNARLAISGARTRANMGQVPQFNKCSEYERLRRLVVNVACFLGF